eukprot:GFUD01004476.1.p1 GENE.GFUD01004476.1~~GFUD01004476.1.p1  ORF type:complete len:195 (+),score=31.82 GFUD01004476.1:102-686(+)
MIFKPSSVSKLFNECYPMAIGEYKNNTYDDAVPTDLSIDNAFQHLEKERLAVLLQILTRTLTKQVLYRCSKVLELGPLVYLDLPTPTIDNILTQMILLGEREPYGVRGGTLVVMFGPPPTQTSSPIKIGRFPLDPTTVSTYELHLTIQSTSPVKLQFANLWRRMQRKQEKLVVDDKFSLVKKKLYRSSTSSGHE